MKIKDQQTPVKQSKKLPPSIYLINVGSIAKPHAMQQLHADVTSLKPEVVIVTESWLTYRHKNELFDLPDYTLFRMDRVQRKVNGRLRRGGGVAIWVNKRLDALIFTPLPVTDPNFELLWLCCEKDSRPCYIAGLYHPPDPLYQERCLLDCIEQSLDEINKIQDDALICLAGDFNQISDMNIQMMGLMRESTPPTRGDKCLDRIYTNFPVFKQVDVFNSTVKTDHKAIFAYSIFDLIPVKSKSSHTFRRCLPEQRARFFGMFVKL